jgi:hypothetical protein
MNDIRDADRDLMSVKSYGLEIKFASIRIFDISW